MTDAEPDPRRRPKGDKRERTRARLLEAALGLIREKGYERTTMDDIARRAGMTSGAIYGNFKHPGRTVPGPGTGLLAADQAGDQTRLQLRRKNARAGRGDHRRRPRTAPGRRRPPAEGMAHTLESRRAAGRGARPIRPRSYASGAAWLRTAAEDGDLPMPPEALVVVIHALTEGLLFQRFVTPELVPDEVIYAAFAALAGKT